MRTGPTTIEERLNALEEKFAKLNAVARKPWWEQFAGSFAGDPGFEEAMKLGAAYRKSTRKRRGGHYVHS